MCRLFGFVSHKLVAVTHLLEDIYESFVKISHLHGDGWGLAWYDESDLLHSEIIGVTDSERYFLALLSKFEKSSPIEAFQTHLRAMHEHLQSSSLNCLLLTPDALFAVCDFDAAVPLAQQEPDYFHIQYQVNNGAVVVASTGLNPGSGWEILRSGQMLVVERDTLRVTVIDVALNSRNSIKEQYKSALQR